MSYETSRNLLFEYAKIVLAYKKEIPMALLYNLKLFDLDLIPSTHDITNNTDINNLIKICDILGITNLKIDGCSEIILKEPIKETEIDCNLLRRYNFFPNYSEKDFSLITKFVNID